MHRRKRLSLVTSLGGTLVVVGVLVYLLTQHGSEVEQAANRVSAATLVIVIALAGITLLARSEEAAACMAAMDRRPRRIDIHAASSIAFLLSTLNHYIASPVRAGILQRLDRARAPTILQMVLVDGSTYLIEGLLAAVLLVVSASALKLHWWIPGLAIAGAIGALALAFGARRRFQHHAMFQGLEMLAHSRYRAVVLALTVVVFACQISRTLIILDAVGLHPTLLQAVATFIAAGVLSSLLAGPGAGTTAAPLLVFGHQAIAAATAAGLILSITALLAAVAYALIGGPVILWRLRRHDPVAELRPT
jgi:hypothetical protein